MQNYMKTIISAVQTWVKGKIKDSTADWNQNNPSMPDYVKNRTHYEETQVVEVLAECTPPYIEDNGVFLISDAVEGVTAGETYVVNWNGTEYRCVAQTNEDDAGYVFHVLGDIGGVSGEGTSSGEPFLIMLTPADLVATGIAGGQILAIDGSTTLTISIRQEVTTTHPIDIKYLPVNRITFTKDADSNYVCSHTGAEIYEMAKKGAITVSFYEDGFTVECAYIFAGTQSDDGSANFISAVRFGDEGRIKHLTVPYSDVIAHMKIFNSTQLV